MQNVFITGHIGGDAATRTAGRGKVTNFNVAVGQGYGQDEKTNWFRCALWGDRGDKLAQYLTKGTKVAVAGELSIGEYEGKPQYDIRVNDVEFMSKGGGGTPQQETAPTREKLDDDVPF